MKKVVKRVLIVLAILVGGCIYLVIDGYHLEKKEKKELKSLSKKNWKDLVFDVDRGWEVDESLLTYYDSMEESLQKTKMSTFTDIPYARNVDMELKRMENAEYGMFFYLSFLDEDNGTIMATKFKVREKGGKRQYALFIIEPIEGKRGAKTIGTFEESVHAQLRLNDFSSINGIDRDKRFAWCCSTYKDIYNITVEGQKPTEIIPYEFLGETEYFWYFEDIKSTKPGAALEIKVEEK